MQSLKSMIILGLLRHRHLFKFQLMQKSFYNFLEGIRRLRKEILLDDSLNFAKKAKAAGVDITLLVGEGMCHCYPAFGNLFPEARNAMNEICSFIKEHIN